MSGPSNETSPSHLWAALHGAARPNKVVDFPRWDENGKSLGKVRIRILTQEEQMVSKKAAEDFARRMLKDGKKGDLGYEALYTDALIVEIIYRACRAEEDVMSPAFPPPDVLRSTLTTEEFSTLFDHYQTVQLELGPTALTLMSDAECEAWIDRLVEAGSGSPLDLLSTDQRTILTMYMAYHIRSSQKDKSSSTGQLESGQPSDAATS